LLADEVEQQIEGAVVLFQVKIEWRRHRLSR
jgi:hypothetical protein